LSQLREHLCLYAIIGQTISGIGKKARSDAAATLLPPEKEDCEQQEQMEATRETAYGFVVSERQPLLFEGGALRPYQLDGLDWLKVLCIYGSYFLLQSVYLKVCCDLHTDQYKRSDILMAVTMKTEYCSLLGCDVMSSDRKIASVLGVT
jgi:hypothetical protein